jgi:class 3 adenylate cyclase
VRDSWTGIWVDGEWFAEGVSPELDHVVEALVTDELISASAPRIFEWQGDRFLLLARELNPGSPLGRGVQVAVFSLARLDDAVGKLRWGVAMLGGASLLISVVVAWTMARRFSDPILRLVEATNKVREGDLSWKVAVRGKDEFATLAGDFNRMTEDLSLKERYRDLLGKTSDPSVADRLMEGSIQLGGEIRQAAVVFCDIRGFTAMTDGMAPGEVIDMLNDHMTAMTRVIHEHGGVVDKFVGDLVMAVFGAPISRDDDTDRSAACATAMIRTRAEMNAATGHPVEIGIGLAAGEIVAGLMGSEDRLNYTVLGDRVNLASRLCSLAGAGEVLVDGETAALLPPRFRAQARGTVEVRGFRDPVEIRALEVGGVN